MQKPAHRLLLKVVSPLLISLLVACATVSTKKQSNPTELAQVKANCQKRTAISGTAYFTTSLEDQKRITAPGVILAQWPDKLRIEVQDPVGGTLALVVLHGDRFWFYRASEKEILTGPVSKFPTSNGLIANVDGLVSALLARPHFDSTGKRSFVENGVEIQEVGGKTSVRWNARTLEPEEILVEGKGRFRFAEYEARAGISFPKKVELMRELPGQKNDFMNIEWRDWQPFVPDEKKLFQIPQQQTFGRKIKALR